MSIIKKALDKAELENKEKLNSDLHSTKVIDAASFNEKKIDRQFHTNPPPRALNKHKSKIRDNINILKNSIFIIIIILIIGSIPYFLNIKFSKNKTDFENIPLKTDNNQPEKKNENKKIEIFNEQFAPPSINIVNEHKEYSEKKLELSADIENQSFVQQPNYNYQSNEKKMTEKNEPVKSVKADLIAEKIQPAPVKKNIEKQPAEIDISEINAMIKEGDHYNAIKILEAKLKKDKRNLELIKILAEINFNIKNYKTALNYYNLIIDIADESDAYLKVGMINHLFLKNPKKAVNYYKKYIEKNGEHSASVIEMLKQLENG